jgi:phosphonate transport system substrate-binding protein
VKRLLTVLLALMLTASIVACERSTPPPQQAPKASVSRPEKLIVTAIPDDGDADRMRENFGALAKLIGERVGIPVEYMHVENYAASVTALATGKAHLAWLGAVTTAQAHMQMEDNLVVIGARDIDKGFVTYFVAHHRAGIAAVNDLSELAAAAEGKDWNFTFGSKSSTSSHLMPRNFFTVQSGKKPEEIFRTVAYSGSHDVVMQKVADGSFTIGAMNYASWDKASDELKAQAPIIYKTPPFTNYCLTARADLGAELLGEIRAALLGVTVETEEGRKILGYLKAGKFIEADLSEWADYRVLLESGVDIGG